MTLPWWGTACRRRAALARGAGLGLGLAWLVALHPGHADEGGEIPEPITITLSKAKLQPVAALQNAKIDHIDFLPDGRIAVIGGVSPADGGYLRIIDPKTGDVEEHYLPDGNGIGGLDRTGPEVAVVGDATFLYTSNGVVQRFLSQDAVVEGRSGIVVDPGLDVEAAAGAMSADRDSVLVSWWEMDPSKRSNECGDGAAIARLSSEGKAIWRWQDPKAGFNFPNDILVLADGTILVLVKGGPNEWMGTMWNFCAHGQEYLVALAPDGRELARLDLPANVWLESLSLGWNGAEVIATAGPIGGDLDAIMRIRIESGRLRLDRIEVAGKVSKVSPYGAIATSLEAGGYRLILWTGEVVTLDECGDVVSAYSPALGGDRCHIQGNRGLICWSEREISVLPLR